MTVALDNKDRSSRRRFAALIAAEMAALTVAALATIYFDLGWPGAIGIALLVAGFTIAIVRSAESRAKATGNFSPAMARYNRRMLTAIAVYVVGLLAAIWVHDAIHPNGLAAVAIAFLPSVGVLWMVWAMARLLAEEQDEYQRHRLVRSSLFGLGTLLTVATVWGFFEQFDLVPHVPTWAAVPVFALGLGLSNCIRWGNQ